MKALLLACVMMVALATAAVHWTYEGEEGPEYWAKLSPDYADCDGSRQSPIDINTKSAKIIKDKGFLRMYSALPLPEPAPGLFQNNGHTVQLSLLQRGLRIAGSTFPTLADTIQCHFHTPSEHMLDGKHYPLELHIVNGDAYRGNASKFQIVVLGILFEEGEEEDSLLNQLIPSLPDLGVHGDIKNVTVSIAPEFNIGSEFYEYEGSLTTPPCYEVVHWVVAKKIRSATKEQIKKFEHAMGENSRPVQKLNGRTITQRILTNEFHMKCKEAGKQCPEGTNIEAEGICKADLCPEFEMDCCGTPKDCTGGWVNVDKGKCSKTCGTGVTAAKWQIKTPAKYGGKCPNAGRRKTAVCNNKAC